MQTKHRACKRHRGRKELIGLLWRRMKRGRREERQTDRQTAALGVEPRRALAWSLDFTRRKEKPFEHHYWGWDAGLWQRAGERRETGRSATVHRWRREREAKGLWWDAGCPGDFCGRERDPTGHPWPGCGPCRGMELPPLSQRVHRRRGG